MYALIVTDVQNDFCPGGALALPEGDRVVPVINELQGRFELVVATQDWHPPDHGSFAANHPGRQPGQRIELAGLEQILWPVHCVQDTAGAELHSALDRSRIAKIFRKGGDPQVDSYSGFFDNGRRKSTGLADYLKRCAVTHVYITGLTTDYCVKFTALDAVGLGFAATVVQDACRGVNLRPGDVDRALAEMHSGGVRVIKAEEI